MAFRTYAPASGAPARARHRHIIRCCAANELPLTLDRRPPMPARHAPPALPRCSIALPQQAALTIILLLYNGQLCQRNASIQLAYSTLQLGAARRGRALLERLSALRLWQHWERAYEAGRSCSAAVLAAPASAREAVRAACMEAAIAAPAADPPAAPSLEHGTELCLRYQPARWADLGAPG